MTWTSDPRLNDHPDGLPAHLKQEIDQLHGAFEREGINPASRSAAAIASVASRLGSLARQEASIASNLPRPQEADEAVRQAIANPPETVEDGDMLEPEEQWVRPAVRAALSKLVSSKNLRESLSRVISDNVSPTDEPTFDIATSTVALRVSLAEWPHDPDFIINSAVIARVSSPCEGLPR